MAADLLITKFPGRTGLYLAVQEEDGARTIARFVRGDESAKLFVQWCIEAGIRYEEPEKEAGK